MWLFFHHKLNIINSHEWARIPINCCAQWTGHIIKPCVDFIGVPCQIDWILTGCRNVHVWVCSCGRFVVAGHHKSCWTSVSASAGAARAWQAFFQEKLRSTTWHSEAICHSSNALFHVGLLWVSPTRRCPLANCRSLSEDGDTFGSSPAVFPKKEKRIAPVRRLLAFFGTCSCGCLSLILSLWQDSLARWGLGHIFLGATYSTVCIHVWHRLSPLCHSYSSFFLWKSRCQ